MTENVIIIPCSGIGKPYGSISREAVYVVCEDLIPGIADTDCLGGLVIKDPEIVERILNAKVYSVDGCFNECARKSIERVGGEVQEAFHVWKFHQENKELKPKSTTFLDEDGIEFSKQLGQKIAEKIKEDLGGEK